MRRRNLLQLGGAALGGALVAPAARTASGGGAFRARRVVIVSIGGGLRKRETLGMAEGATMPRILGGIPFVAGHGELAGAPKIAPEYVAPRVVLPPPRRAPLHTAGALVSNLRYDAGSPGHLQGAACLSCGAYATIPNRADARPPAPTIFELVRRAENAPATQAWYLSNVAGFYRALRASDHPEFGARYAGAWMSPASTFDPMFAAVARGKRRVDTNDRPRVDVPADAAAVSALAAVVNDGAPAFADDGEIRYDADDTARVTSYLADAFADPTFAPIDASRVGIGLVGANGAYAPTRDAVTIDHAERILERFRPRVTMVSLIDVDTCHNDFNAYLVHQTIADALVCHLWDFIQSTDGLRDETAMFVLPEHGRHLDFNGKNEDSLGRSGLDHGAGDDGDRDVWALALGPDFAPGVHDPTSITQPGRTSGRYETIDVVHTALALLGHDTLHASTLGELGLRPGLVMEGILR